MGATPTAQDTARARQEAIDQAHLKAGLAVAISTGAGALSGGAPGAAIGGGAAALTGCLVSCHLTSPAEVPRFEVKPAPLPEADTEEVEYVEPVGSIPCPPSSGVLREKNKKKK